LSCAPLHTTLLLPSAVSRSRVTEQGFALLAGLPQLHTLWVDCCKLTPPVLMAVACSTSLALLQVHRSHPEAGALTRWQQALLARVRGPRLEVVVREGPRSREEVMRAHGGVPAWGGGGCGSGSPCGGGTEADGSGSGFLAAASGGWGGAEGLLAGGRDEVCLDPAHLWLLGGAGGVAGGLGGGGADDGGDPAVDDMLAEGLLEEDGGFGGAWLPDLGDLHL
jgi:hypothetical protein